MSEYTQGICQDGAAILRDGQQMTIEEILEALRERDALEFQNRNREGLVRRAIEMEEAYGGLAAHVERLTEGGQALRRELEQWALTERDPETRAAFLAWDFIVGETPNTSLARLKAQWQYEALDCEPLRILMGLVEDGLDDSAWMQARNLLAYQDELRRQAQGEEATP